MLHQPPQVFFCYFGLPCINGFLKSLFFPNSSSLWYLQFLDSPSSFSVTLLWRSYYWKVKGGAGICGKPFVSRNHPPFPQVAFLIFLNFWENQKLHFYILQVFSTLVSFEVEGAFESSWAPTRPCVELALLHLLLLLFIIIFITFHHLLNTVCVIVGRKANTVPKKNGRMEYISAIILSCNASPSQIMPPVCWVGGSCPPPTTLVKWGFRLKWGFSPCLARNSKKTVGSKIDPTKGGPLSPHPTGVCLIPRLQQTPGLMNGPVRTAIPVTKLFFGRGVMKNSEDFFTKKASADVLNFSPW